MTTPIFTIFDVTSCIYLLFRLPKSCSISMSDSLSMLRVTEDLFHTASANYCTWLSISDLRYWQAWCLSLNSESWIFIISYYQFFYDSVDIFKTQINVVNIEWPSHMGKQDVSYCWFYYHHFNQEIVLTFSVRHLFFPSPKKINC